MIGSESIEELIVSEVAATGYHPRTSKHSDSQSYVIIRDLLAGCPELRKRASTGDLVAKLRHHQQVGHNDWVIDIALGTPAGPSVPPEAGTLIRETAPAIIQIAIELKSIWTEHGKARKNRLRDFTAFHGYAHQYDPRTVAAAFLVINAADFFLSPLNLNSPDREPITVHGGKGKTAQQLVRETIDIFRSIHLRTSDRDVEGLEGLGVVVVRHDNLNILIGQERYASVLARYQHRGSPSVVARVPPALPVGDPLHYQSMLQRVCSAYTERFAR